MADLQDFFAKKDKKKKKSGKVTVTVEDVEAVGKGVDSKLSLTDSHEPSAEIKPSAEGANADSVPPTGEEQPASTKATVPDDGWVELEEATAQVNTGGRAIVELRREPLNEADGGTGTDGTGTAAEKFQGWKTKAEDGEEPEAKEEEPVEEKPMTYSARMNKLRTDPGLNDHRKFPSLADAAKIQTTKPAAIRKPAPGTKPSGAPAQPERQRPRFNTGGLAAMLQKSREEDALREATGAGAGSSGPTSAGSTNP